MPGLKDCLGKTKRLPRDLKRALLSDTQERVESAGLSHTDAARDIIQQRLQDVRADIATVANALAAPAFATRRGKAAQAAAEGVSREASVAAAFERMHAAPEERLSLLQRIKREYVRIRAQNVAAEAAAPAPQQIDPTDELDRLDAEETKALEDLGVEEQDALDRSSQQIADRYADRILAEQDVDARRALERESKNVAAAQRKGIEKQYAERRKALQADFSRQQRAVTLQAEQANLAATKEGAAQLAKMRRIHAFAELNALVKALPAEIRGRIGGAMTLAQLPTTETALTDFLTKRIAMIDRELERALQKEYRGAIRDLLKRSRPKKQPSGVVKGKLGAETHEMVDRVAGYTEMTGLTVQDAVETIEAKLTKGGLTPEQESAEIIKQNELNTFGAIDEMSADELSTAYEVLREGIKQGRFEWNAIEEQRLAGMRTKATEIITGYPKGTSPGIAAQNEKVLSNWFRNFSRSHLSLGRLLHRLFPKLTYTQQWADETRRAENADRDYVNSVTERFQKAMMAATGTKSALAVGKMLTAMNNRNIDVPGGKITKREAIHYFMAWQQPKERARMEKQGWTEEIINRLDKELNDPGSQAILTFLRQIYDEIYEKSDPVHRRNYGVSLTKNPNYVPMRYQPAGMEADPLVIGGPLATSGLTPNSLKGRVAHDQPLKTVDALQVFMEHLAQMSHWIHFADINREMRGVLGNSDAKLNLKQLLGDKGYTDMMRQIDTIARGGAARAADVSAMNDAIKYMSSTVAVTALAGNLHTVIMQSDSGLRWAFEIPARRWIPLLLSGKWITAFPKAWHSPTIQRRIIEGMSPAMKYAMQATNLTPAKAIYMIRASFWPAKMFDAFATSLSSGIVYADAIRQGMSEEQALDKMDAAVHRFSQPISLTAKSQLEIASGPGTKMLLMFMADPIIKTAIFSEALHHIVTGQGEGRGMAAQRAFVSLFVLTAASWYMSALYRDWFTDDDDDEIWTWGSYLQMLALVPFQGWAYFGNAAEAVIAYTTGGKAYPKETAPAQLASRLVRIIKKVVEDPQALVDFSDSKKAMRNMDNIAKVLGFVPGMQWAPILSNMMKPAVGAAQNIEKQED